MKYRKSVSSKSKSTVSEQKIPQSKYLTEVVYPTDYDVKEELFNMGYKKF